MDLFQAIVLAVVQGVTEWLPVSSSGHLVIMHHFLNIEPSVQYDVLLHFATLFPVLIILRKDILSMIKSILSWQSGSEDFRLFWFLILGSVPIAIVGLLFKTRIETAFSSLFIVSLGLLFSGTILFLTKFNNLKSKLNPKNALLIGIIQSIAVVPGVSRSGSTISTAMILGINRDKAARFSFLLFIPAILGAIILESLTLDWSSLPITNSLIGFLVSAITGFIALKWLLGFIHKGRLHNFAWYCWFLGFFLLVYSVF